MPLTLRWTATTTLPVESEALRPDFLAGRSSSEVLAQSARVGRETVSLGDLFRAEGDAADGHLILEGDLSHVRRIGSGMASGRITIRGDAGSHLGSSMSGGTIKLLGSASTWAGAEMRGGLLHIRGSAGDFLGASYPGSVRGMRDGLILVEGGVGRDAGLAMRRGLIAVGGPAGLGLGRGLIAGSVFAFGPVERGAGAGMKRGTLALFNPGPEFVPPLTFTETGTHRFPFLTIYLRALRELGFPLPDKREGRAVHRYNGDRLEGGLGELLIPAFG